MKETDFYNLDGLLTDEEKLVRQSVREFVDDKVLPVIEEYDRKGTFPKQLVSEIASLGLLGANLKGYGCAGLNNVAYGLMLQELERGDSGLRSFVSVQGALCMYPIYAFGSEDQKQEWLPGMAKGELIACFGLTEPDFGSNPGGMLTRAEAKKGGYVLNGTKMWITNGCIADLAIIWAKLEGEVRGFVVDCKTDGFSSRPVPEKFSLRASVTSELHMDNVEVPEESLLPGAIGLKGPLQCLNQARYGISWGALGAAMACYECAVHYAQNRIQFDKPIASFQMVQKKLAWMLTEITKGQLLAWRLATLKDEGSYHHTQVSMAKMNNVEIALDIARQARDILGANGICDEYPVGRHMRNLESVKTYEGTHDIHTLVLGEAITGIAAYY